MGGGEESQSSIEGDGQKAIESEHGAKRFGCGFI